MALFDYDKKIERVEKDIEESEEISKANRKKIQKFARDLRVNDYSKTRIFKLENKLKIIAENIEFDFEKATEDQIKDFVAWVNEQDFSDSTKNDYKVILKRFYKWLNDGEYPKCVDWISTTLKKSNDKLPKNVLVEDDIQDLIEAAENPRDKALIAMLWETGARIGELIDLEIGDLEDFRHGKKVVINGKTGPRRVPLISSVPHIQAWINSHPDGNDPEAPLWVNVGTRNQGDKIQYRALRKTLDEIMKRTDVDKPSNPHHFRHSRATYMASRFTEAQMCEYFGWVQGSDVPAKYVHMSGRDIDGDYVRMHGIEDEEEKEKSKLAPESCPRCGGKVDPNASFCQNCGQALTTDAAESAEQREARGSSMLKGILKGRSRGEIIEALERFLDEETGN